ncbi:Gypsy retrotransposon integrase-like protein 1 [Elysia marginata]|uniref:Gypsy retrotransposon integrase-like protein 1 n=1 Tax=Elysia marginata TaxID=1093978 RepID=A0AAV4HER2_9GAST|nr:Gypsy retrotransposon integrase-like protein 1 [Elysia marginata]
MEIAKAAKIKSAGNKSQELLSKIPKMSPFSEAKGDTMDAFIFRFEMVVKSYDWTDDYRRGYHSNRGTYLRRNSARRGYNENRGSYRGQDYRYGNKRKEYISMSSITESKHFRLFAGKVNNTPCSVLPDTGCTCVGIKQSLIKPQDYTGEYATCIMFDGSQCHLPTAHAYIETPFFTGHVIALALRTVCSDIILGNILGINDSALKEQSPDDGGREQDKNGYQKFGHVLTRAQSRTETQNSSHAPDHESTDTDVNGFKSLNIHTCRIEQEKDETLNAVREKAVRGNGYHFKDGLIYRKSRKVNTPDQLVVPRSLRGLILKACHDIPIAGHMGVAATKKRLCSRCSWPGIMNDTLQFVKSCDTCHRTCNRLPRLPVQQADMIDKPFDKVAIDIVGPLPMTESKCRYILTLVDMGTRWPEALPLKEIRTSDVVSGLFTIFSRLGVPKQILSDNRKQLIS